MENPYVCRILGERSERLSVEIERKFLITDVPSELPRGPGARLRQGYVAQEGDVEVRIRIVDEEAAVLTVKAGRGLVRTEVEMAVPLQEAEDLWRHTEGRRLEKVRHSVVVGSHRAEVDIYGGALAGLRTVEVEFASAGSAAAFAAPAWFARELTDEEGWDNASLARRGVPDATTA